MGGGDGVYTIFITLWGFTGPCHWEEPARGSLSSTFNLTLIHSGLKNEPNEKKGAGSRAKLAANGTVLGRWGAETV